MFSPALAQSVPTSTNTANITAPATTSTDFLSIGLPLIFMVALYMLVVRPHNKRLGEQKKMVETLKIGDEIVTTAGLMGIVTHIKESEIHLKVADALELLLQRQSVQHILPKGTVKLPLVPTKHVHKN